MRSLTRACRSRRIVGLRGRDLLAVGGDDHTAEAQGRQEAQGQQEAEGDRRGGFRDSRRGIERQQEGIRVAAAVGAVSGDKAGVADAGGVREREAGGDEVVQIGHHAARVEEGVAGGVARRVGIADDLTAGVDP